MRRFSVLLLFFGLVVVEAVPQAAHPPVPVLIELFTSEGCSSCPPADLWLQKIDVSQPIPGVDAIVMSEHVDYWDHDGWKDPYSSPLFSERQSDYVRAFGLSTAYTPELIVNGKTELRLNDPRQVAKALQQSAGGGAIPLSIGPVTVEGSSPAILRAHIEVDGRQLKVKSDIVGVVALDHALSHVLRGENGGRQLTHVAVVEEMKKLGKLDKGGSFSTDFQTPLPAGADPLNLRLIVLAQETGQGQVLGVAARKPAAQ